MFLILQRAVSIVLWLCILVLLVWATHLKDPHLLVIRSHETDLILAGCVAGFLAVRQKSRGIERTALFALLVAVAGITLGTESLHRYRKAAVLSRDLDIERRLSRHFIIGYRDLADLRPLLVRGIVGGVFVTQRNAYGKTAEQLRGEIAEMQQLRRSSGMPDLIVATDQEGGVVSRLSPPLMRRPALSSLAAGSRGQAKLFADAEDYGRQQGMELADLGVTVNFSPVVDLKAEVPGNRLDLHSRISQRAISSSPEQTAMVALAYGRGLESRGVRPTLKHFPGLGGVRADTHHFSATLVTPVGELATRDWLPFRHAVAQSGALIMLGHVILPGIDPENPVSFSRAVVQDVIRGAWQHEGLLVTDDLTMAAAYNHGLCEATVKGLNAGVDLLLISYDDEKFYESMYCAVAAYKNSSLEEDQLRRSDRRLELKGGKIRE